MASEAIGRAFDSRRARHTATKLGTASSFSSFDNETARARARLAALDVQLVSVEAYLVYQQVQMRLAES